MDTTGNIKTKQISDYLHLYLGCEVFWQHKNTKDYICKLISTDNINCDLWLNDHKYHTSIQCIKPILREISDITEEEAEKIVLILFSDVDDKIDSDEIQLDLVKGDGGLMVDGDIYLIINVSCRCFEGQIGIRKCGTPNLFDEDGEVQRLANVTEYFRYIISIGIDVFGLIESGLAIDKTKMT